MKAAITRTYQKHRFWSDTPASPLPILRLCLSRKGQINDGLNGENWDETA